MSIYDKKEAGKRLTEAIIALGKNSRQFAIAANADPSYIAKIEKGQKPISKTYLNKFEKQFNINHQWLLFGKEEMFLNGTIVPHQEQKEEIRIPDRGILDKYISMLEEDKKYFQELVKTNLMALLNQQRYIHADIKGIAKREAERDVNGNQVQLKKELHKISIYAGEYLGEGAKADNRGNEDK